VAGIIILTYHAEEWHSGYTSDRPKLAPLETPPEHREIQRCYEMGH